MSSATAMRGGDTPSTELAVPGTTNAANFIKSSPDHIAQDVPHDQGYSLDKLLAYCRRNLGKIRKAGQRKNVNSPILPPTQRPPSTGDVPNGAALTEQDCTGTQFMDQTQDRNAPVTHADQHANQQSPGHEEASGPRVDTEVGVRTEGENATSGTDVLSMTSFPGIKLPQIPEVREETVDLPSANSGVVAQNAEPKVVTSEISSQFVPSQREDITFEPLSGSITGFEIRTKWKNLPPFRFFGDKFLATGLAPDDEYLRLWRETWQPTLRHKIDTLSIDAADVFVFDLKMVGSKAKLESMKPTILAICNDSVTQKLKSGLSEIVEEITPKDIAFEVIGKDVALASPSVVRSRTMDSKISLDVELWRDLLDRGEALNVYEARVYHKRLAAHYTSTVGGYVAIGSELFALTTAHSMFKNGSKQLNRADKADDNMARLPYRGSLESYSWCLDAAWKEQMNQDRLFTTETPMDWALISIPSSLDPTFNSPADLFRLSPEARQQLQRPLATSYNESSNLNHVGDVIIHGGFSGTQSGVLSKTSCIFMIRKVPFIAYSVALEHCLVDGDSGSWVISRWDHKLCGYIFARVVGFEWAYMLPISPIIDDILRKAPRSSDRLTPDITLFSVAAMESAMTNKKAQRIDHKLDDHPTKISGPIKPSSDASSTILATIKEPFEDPNIYLLASTRSDMSYVSPQPIVFERPPESLPYLTVATPLTSTSSPIPQENSIRLPSVSRAIDNSVDREQYQNSVLTATRSGVAPSYRDAANLEGTIVSPRPLDISSNLDEDLEQQSPQPDARQRSHRETRAWKFLTGVPAMLKRTFPRTYKHLWTYRYIYATLIFILTQIVLFAALATYGWLVFYCVTTPLPIYLKVLGIGAGLVALALIWVIRDQILRLLWKYRPSSRRLDMIASLEGMDVASMRRTAAGNTFLERRLAHRMWIFCRKHWRRLRARSGPSQDDLPDIQLSMAEI